MPFTTVASTAILGGATKPVYRMYDASNPPWFRRAYRLGKQLPP